MKKLLTILLTISILLSTGLATIAADSKHYEAGYEAGWKIGSENFGKNISAATAWKEYKNSKEYDYYDFGDDKDAEEDYEDGFYIGYEEGSLGNPIKINYADTLGKALGSIYGYGDFQDGTKSNWEKALPNDRTLRRMFNLDMETSEYREAFLIEFKVAFQEAYLDGYEKALLDPVRTSLQQGVKDGEDLGKLLGATFGAKDYYEKRDSDFTRNLPSDRDIIAEYSLNGDTDEYKDGFLSGFKRAYEAEYNKFFREANKNETIRDEKDAYNHGKEVGKKAGEMTAVSDYLQQKVNDWKRSIPNDETIIREYNLTLQSANYRDGFIAGFYDGYSEGYNGKFKEFSQGSAMDKSNSEIIPLKGGTLNSLDNAMNLNIQSGTYYHPVHLTIDTIYNTPSLIASSYIKASDSYRVNLLNTSQNLDNKKLIELEFEYYGDKIKGGIYKFVEGKWMYLPSVIEDGVIKTYVRPSQINGTYSAFVDTNTFIFPDSRGHWAKDEINTYVRRNIIFGYSDGSFKPDRNISRAEFLTILSRTYNWNVDFFYFGNANLFKDYELFGSRANIINYSTAMGYISGYPDGTFKPDDPISYNEVEIIMRRVLTNMNFKWSDISTKMLHEKKVKSSSVNNINNKITRAEVIYMLHELNQGRY